MAGFFFATYSSGSNFHDGNKARSIIFLNFAVNHAFLELFGFFVQNLYL